MEGLVTEGSFGICERFPYGVKAGEAIFTTDGHAWLILGAVDHRLYGRRDDGLEGFPMYMVSYANAELVR